MGIKSTIPIEQINKMLKDRAKKATAAIINTLKYVGEMCVAEARNNGDYVDRSGNLRSSIGYVVLNNGKIEEENFKKSERGSSKTEGITQSKIFIKELSSRYSKGIVLIVVAGMKYASYVEAKRNVLASARLLAEKEVPRILNELGFR